MDNVDSYIPLYSKTRITRIPIFVAAGINAIVALLLLASLDSSTGAEYYQLPYLLWQASTWANLAALAFFLFWVWRAAKNTDALSPLHLEYDPAWSSAWFLIPVANFWMPCLVMRELFQKSDPERIREIIEAEKESEDASYRSEDDPPQTTVLYPDEEMELPSQGEYRQFVLGWWLLIIVAVIGTKILGLIDLSSRALNINARFIEALGFVFSVIALLYTITLMNRLNNLQVDAYDYLVESGEYEEEMNMEEYRQMVLRQNAEVRSTTPES